MKNVQRILKNKGENLCLTDKNKNTSRRQKISGCSILFRSGMEIY
jgi:hypothetical protein